MMGQKKFDVTPILFIASGVVLVVGIVYKLITPQGVKTTTVQPTPTVAIAGVNSKSKALDLNKPVECLFQTKNSSYSAALEGASMAIALDGEKNKRRIVIQGDCMYQWEHAGVVGVKRCGVGPLVAIGRQLFGSGLVGNDQLRSMVQGKLGVQSDTIVALIESCGNVKNLAKEKFVLPQSVIFTEVKTDVKK